MAKLLNRIYEVDTLKCLKSAKLIVFYLKTREEEECRVTVTFARVDILKHNMHTNIPIPFLYMGHYPRNCRKKEGKTDYLKNCSKSGGGGGAFHKLLPSRGYSFRVIRRLMGSSLLV